MAVTFNGAVLDDMFIVTNPKRPLPAFNVSTTDVGGRDGVMFDGTKMERRECSFDVYVVDKANDGIQRAARALMELFAVREPRPLTFSDEKDAGGTQLVRYAVPNGAFDHEAFIDGGMWHCSFIQPDPYLYGKERVGVLEKGVTYVLETGGNAPAYPTFEAFPSAQHGLFQVGVFYGSQNSIGGYDYKGKVTFNGNYVDGSGNAFSGTNKLWCDMEAQAVTFQRMAYDPGKPVKGLTLDSRFFSIQGRERIRAEFADVTMTWRERWL